MGDIRMGLIGLGSMGRHHARVIRETPGMQLVAAADPAGDKFGAARDLPVLPDVEALIGAGIDAAMVAVPTLEHEAVALALAAAGVHTMVEKPIAHDVPAGERVAAAFAEAGLVGAVGYVERCNPAIVEMRRRLRDGQLGTIFQITTARWGRTASYRDSTARGQPGRSTSWPPQHAHATRRCCRFVANLA